MLGTLHHGLCTRRLRPNATLASVAAVLLCLLTACHAGETQAQRPIHPKVNPAAQVSRDIEFRFSGLPGAIHQSGAALHYGVRNRDCVPMDYERALGGVRLLPKYRLAAPVRLSTGGALIVTAWDDALIDENYFDLGECHWVLESVAFTFSSEHGARFVAAIPASELRGGGSVSLRYLVSDYSTNAAPDPAIFGERPGFYSDSKPQFSLNVATQAGAAK